MTRFSDEERCNHILRDSLVTPMLTHWLSPGYNTHTAQIGMLRIQVPEPGAALLLAVGAGVLVLLHRVSRRG